jgi:hypothetical protein
MRMSEEEFSRDVWLLIKIVFWISIFSWFWSEVFYPLATCNIYFQIFLGITICAIIFTLESWLLDQAIKGIRKSWDDKDN